MFGITDWSVHRGERILENIEHIVLQGSFDVAKALKRIYEWEVRSRQTKGIVFVYKWSMANELPQDLKWLLFHGNMDPEEKANAYKKLAQIEEGVMIATSAFSHGVDIRRISHVITVGHVNNDKLIFSKLLGRMWRKEPDEVGRSYILCYHIMPYVLLITPKAFPTPFLSKSSFHSPHLENAHHNADKQP